MDRLIIEMGPTEMITRLSMLAIVSFIILACCCYSICRTRRDVDREIDVTPELPSNELIQPPSYEEALKKMEKQRRRRERASTSSDRRTPGILIEEPSEEENEDDKDTRDTREGSAAKPLLEKDSANVEEDADETNDKPRIVVDTVKKTVRIKCGKNGDGESPKKDGASGSKAGGGATIDIE